MLTDAGGQPPFKYSLLLRAETCSPLNGVSFSFAKGEIFNTQ